MDNSRILNIAKTLSKQIPDNLNASERADLFAYFAVEMKLIHLLRLEARPPNPNYVPIPALAPETYRRRENKREKPPEFIARVYKKWLGKGLARNHLLNLDRPLYDALYNWLKKNKMPEDLDLPMLKELNDRQLAELGIEDGETLPHPSFGLSMRDELRLYHASMTRARAKGKEDKSAEKQDTD
ncbi:hypothetical protein J7400_20880 [Shimia sp. R9_2]|uniref:hypothetical protein n=1 Tax=Shimia sp. R9_2 TaxID=2821112 RepID=UPI001ADBE308|nr:hypothetical protein [Shimia sp. R9_2]MBO9399138.1 hypothetical protein [Shimia sp. R9_2]